MRGRLAFLDRSSNSPEEDRSEEDKKVEELIEK